MTTRFGVHLPSNYYWVPDNYIAFCEDLKRHGVSAVLGWWNDLHQLEFAKALLDHGIEVIYRPGLCRIPSRVLGGIQERYRRVGVKYCQWENEPNLKGEWKEWPGPSAPEKFADHYQHPIRALKSLGFTPVLAPLSPGGHIFHRDFFNRWMACWGRLGIRYELLDGCVLGIHNRPITNPPHSDDPCSFNEYRWYRQRTKYWFSESLPMIATEAGYEPSWCKDPGGSYNWGKWVGWNWDLIRRFRRDHTEYVGDDFLYHIFWLLDDLNGTWDECSLINNYRYSLDHYGDRTTELWKRLEREDWPDNDNGNGGGGMGYMWVRDGLEKRGVKVLDLRPKLWEVCRQAECLRTQRAFQDIDGVVVHHSTEVESGMTDPYLLALYHIKTRGYKCPGYHVYISKDGLLTIVNKLLETAEHSGRDIVNWVTVGVCFIGDFTKDEPTSAQLKTFWALWASLGEFVTWAHKRTRDLWVLPHRYVVSTECPGYKLEEALLDCRGR